ncbi:MAG: HTH domain-containing protein [Chloroflexi bacterium]|nr:HTH domain-containing protein [Chloroflexota bacterium]
MLEKLLRLIAAGGTHSLADLAHKLGVSEEQLRQMIADLTRLGYLRLVAGGCEDHCAGCSLASVCAVSSAGQVWSLTDKGERAARGVTRT